MNEYDLIAVGARCAPVSDGDDPRQAAASGEPPEWLTRAIAGEAPTLAAAAQRVAVGVPELTVITRLLSRGSQVRVLPAPFPKEFADFDREKI